MSYLMAIHEVTTHAPNIFRIRDSDLQVVFGLSYYFLVQLRKKTFPIMCKEAPLSTMYIMSFDFMIGLGLDVFASSSGE